MTIFKQKKVTASVVENNDDKQNLEATDETIMPAIKAPQLVVEEDHLDSISPRDLPKMKVSRIIFQIHRLNPKILARTQDIHDDKNNLDDHSADMKQNMS